MMDTLIGLLLLLGPLSALFLLLSLIDAVLEVWHHPFVWVRRWRSSPNRRPVGPRGRRRRPGTLSPALPRAGSAVRG